MLIPLPLPIVYVSFKMLSLRAEQPSSRGNVGEFCSAQIKTW